MSHPSKKLLVLTHAFPPVQAQVAPVAVKTMGALAKLGYEVDVLTGAPFETTRIPRDESLLGYVDENFRHIHRVEYERNNINALRLHFRLFNSLSDIMAVFNQAIVSTLDTLEIEEYWAILTWSPFHSINECMIAAKRRWPHLVWIAEFSDPLAGNPLERNPLRRVSQYWLERRVVSTADHIILSCDAVARAMALRWGSLVAGKMTTIPHPYERSLYPQVQRTAHEKFVFRHVGTFFGARSPEPLFRSLVQLLDRRPELRNKLVVELVGSVEPQMLETTAAQVLPKGIIATRPAVPYLQSLALMQDADCLLLIESATHNDLFIPSKLADYVGAGTQIIAICPPGPISRAIEGLGQRHASHNDISKISAHLEETVDAGTGCARSGQSDPRVAESFDSSDVAMRLHELLDRI